VKIEYRPATLADIAPRLTGHADLKIVESDGDPSPVVLFADPNVSISLGGDGLHHPMLDLDGKWNEAAAEKWMSSETTFGYVKNDATLIVAPSTNWKFGHLHINGSPMPFMLMMDTLREMAKFGLGSREWLHFVDLLGYGALRLPGVLKVVPQ
jgi:hypothetical protein